MNLGTEVTYSVKQRAGAMTTMEKEREVASSVEVTRNNNKTHEQWRNTAWKLNKHKEQYNHLVKCTTQWEYLARIVKAMCEFVCLMCSV